MPDARPWRHLYNTKQWHKLRAIQLRDNPLCDMCQEQGRVVAATVVDHIKPHKGDKALFFDGNNLQSLCKTHHDSAKQKAERNGVADIGCDASGQPIDAGHHWHR